MGVPRPEYFGAGGHRDSDIAYSELQKNETKFVGRLTDTIVGIPSRVSRI